MASGDTLCIWSAQHGVPPASNMATLDTRNNHPVLDFDATTAETIYFEDLLSTSYSNGGVTVDVYWMASTATTGAVVWSGAWERMQEGGADMDADGFASEQNAAAVTTNGTSGIINKSTMTFTNGAQMDSTVAGNPFRFQLQREPADGSDTMAGDAELVRVHVKET
jgi:hypothetical protein